MESRSPRRSGDQLKDELVAAAELLLAQQVEVRVPSLREIARACGVSAAAVYRHFGSQADLASAVVISRLRALLTELRCASSDAAPGNRETLLRASLVYVRWGLAQPGAYQLIFDGGTLYANPPDVQADVQQLRVRLNTLCAPLAPSGQDPATHADRFWVGLHGIITVRFRNTSYAWERSVEDDVAALIDLYFPPRR